MRIKFTGTENAYMYNDKMEYQYIDVYYYTSILDLLLYLKKTEGKIVIFVSSKRVGEKLYQKCKAINISAAFVTADNKENEAAKTVNSLAEKCKFEEKILITTSVLDVGVNIKDGEVKHVVTMMHDRNTFIQMIGRIRQDEESTGFNLYILANVKSALTNMLKVLNDKIELCKDAERYEKRGELENFVIGCYKEKMLAPDEGELIFSDYGGKLHVNRLARYEYCLMYSEWRDIRDGLMKDPDYFVKKQLQWLGKEEEFTIDDYIDEEVKILRIKKAVREIVKLSKKYNGWYKGEDFEEFLANCKKVILNTDKSLVRSNNNLAWQKFNEIFKLWGYDIDIECDTKKRPRLYRVNMNVSDNVLSSIERSIEEAESEEDDVIFVPDEYRGEETEEDKTEKSEEMTTSETEENDEEETEND